MYKIMGVILVACVAVSGLTGCASIIDGRSQEITFKSVPDGATVVLNGREMGKTPYTAKIDRKADQSVVFQKEGYRNENVPLATTVNGWFFGNIVLGGLVGSTTDSVTGSIHEYSPSFYQVTMTPLAGSVTETTQRIAEVRTYIVANYVMIADELRGTTVPRPYLDALLMLLKVPASQHNDVIEKMKQFKKDHADIADFAKQVAEKLLVH